MRIYRIGGKVVGWEKLTAALDSLLTDRENGATQEEAARAHGVQRSFVSFLETLGEIRRGERIALLAFPVSNVEAVKAVAERYSVDLAIVLSQSQRVGVEHLSGGETFNMVLDTMAELAGYDTLVVAASDKRVEEVSAIFEADVIGLPLGPSPLREDVEVDVEALGALLGTIVGAAGKPRSRRMRVSAALDRASTLVKRWER